MLPFLHLGNLLAVEFGTLWHPKCTKKDVIAAVICCQLLRLGLGIVVSHHCYCISSIHYRLATIRASIANLVFSTPAPSAPF